MAFYEFERLLKPPREWLKEPVCVLAQGKISWFPVIVEQWSGVNFQIVIRKSDLWEIFNCALFQCWMLVSSTGGRNALYQGSGPFAIWTGMSALHAIFYHQFKVFDFARWGIVFSFSNDLIGILQRSAVDFWKINFLWYKNFAVNHLIDQQPTAIVSSTVGLPVESVHCILSYVTMMFKWKPPLMNS